MKENLISIIIPIYNVERYLDRCIETVINQTYKNIEVLLIDDGSSDNCPKICDAWAKKDKRIKVIHKENGGLSDARNVGLDMAIGEYIVFVDGDDYVDNNFIEIMYKRIKQDNSNLVICDYELVDDEYNFFKTDRVRLPNAIWTQEDYWANAYTPIGMSLGVAWNKLYTREIFDYLRFDKGKIHEDLFIIYKIIDRCEKISIVKDRLYFYVQRGGSIINSRFTVKNLDRVEASLNTIEYFWKKGYKENLGIVFIICIGVFMRAKEALDFDIKEVNDRYTELMNRFISIYHEYKKDILNLKDKFQIALFVYFPNCYFMIRRRKLSHGKN